MFSNFKKKIYIFSVALSLFGNTVFSLSHAIQEQIDEHESISSSDSEIVHEELSVKETDLLQIKELSAEYLKDAPDFKKILNSTEPVILLKNESEKRALAIIEMPKKEEIHTLDLEEKELIKELFQTHHVKRFGNKIVIAFTYKDDNLQPETKEQAIYLLLAAYIADQDKTLPEPPIDGILNEKQANALGKKHYKSHPSKLLVNQKLKVTNTRTHEGLSGSTRVKTSTGFTPLQDLQVGDMVACYDQLNKQIVYSQVTHADKIEVQKHVSITINGQELKVAPEHLFHAPALNEWVTAYSLLDDANLCSYVDPNIQDVQLINEKLEVIRISVNSHHNFFITDNNILVHNYIPIVIEVAIAFEIGQEIAFTWAILAPTAMAIATGLFYWITDKFVHDTPRDLLFAPGPMQDYSQILGNNQLDVEFLPYGYAENSNQTYRNTSNSHAGTQNTSIKTRSVHNEAAKTTAQPIKNTQNEVSITASPPSLDPKKPDQDDESSKEKNDNQVKKDGIAKSVIYKRALDAVDKNSSRFKRLNLKNLSEKNLHHIINNHSKIGEIANQRAKSGNSSFFQENIDLIELILDAWEFGKEVSSGAREYDCGRIIGTSSDGNPTSIVKVVLNGTKDAIRTAYPR